MKNLLFAVLAIIICHSTPVLANDTTIYNVYTYIKVAPAQRDNYLKLENAWKKIHAAKQKAGILFSWSVNEVLSPTGASAEYNFVARDTYKGDSLLANYFEGNYMPANWKSLLTPAEVVLVNKTDAIRTIVKTEVYSSVAHVAGKNVNETTITVINFFDHPEGKTRADHIKNEKEVWQPVHAARVKDGVMLGWALMQLDFPFGSDQPYHELTLDAYKDMAQLLKPFFTDYFAKVHPGKNVNDLMKATNEASRLVKGEVRKNVVSLD